MKDDNSLLYACVINDLVLIKQRLVEVKPAQLKKSTQETGTPLHAAALNNNREAVTLLLEAGADIELGNFLRNNALFACIEAGNLDMATFLIEKGSDITKKGCQNRNLLSQLICYAWDRNFAEYLISKGCDVTQTSRDNYGLLNDAACLNNVDAIDFLLQYPVAPEHLHSALCWAIIKNAPAAVHVLLENGANLTDMHASRKGLEKGVYHLAALQENGAELITLLMQHGVDFSKVPERSTVVRLDKTKLSPLDYTTAHLAKWPEATFLVRNIEAMRAADA